MDLRKTLSIWHPRYRTVMAGLVVAGGVASVLVYFVNFTLHALTLALGGKGDQALAEPEGAGAPVMDLVSDLANAIGIEPSALLIVGFGLLNVGIIAVTAVTAATAATGRMHALLEIRSRSDAEVSVFQNLIRRNESFFIRHSIGEIMNRLSVDVRRAANMRALAIRIWGTVLVVFGNLFFFWQKSQSLAVIAALLCFLAAGAILRASRRAQAVRGGYMRSEDAIRARFEDLLGIVPEIQAYRMFRAVDATIRQPMQTRLDRFMGRQMFQIRLQIVQGAFSALALFAVILIAMSYPAAPGAGSMGGLALIPALIWALPRLLLDATNLVLFWVDSRESSKSIERLAEYEHAGAMPAEAVDEPRPAASPEPTAAGKPSLARIELDGVTYRHPALDGTKGGGIFDVTTSFEAGKWTAVAGRIGSGKSTLLGILTMRLEPQSGSFSLDGRRAGDIGEEEIGRIVSYLPQKLFLLDASIRENVLFGRVGDLGDDAQGALSDADWAVIEATGLGRVCRLNALDLPVGDPTSIVEGVPALVALRAAIRSAVAGSDRIDIRGFDDAAAAHGSQMVVEALLGGKCDVEPASEALFQKSSTRDIRRSWDNALGRRLAGAAVAILGSSRQLIELETFEKFRDLSPHPVGRSVWRLRRANRLFAETEPSRVSPTPDLIRIGLTSRVAEWEEVRLDCQAFVETARRDGADALRHLAALLEGAFLPFEATAIHPFLAWRENLLFGTVLAANNRAEKALDRMLLEAIEGSELSRFFAEQGMRFPVGRRGNRLSGGQGQLVALSRALLRHAPLVVLDEPTSALDPNSRDKIADCLRALANERIVVTITHDAELMRRADSIKIMENGHLVEEGDFGALASRSTLLKEVTRVG